MTVFERGLTVRFLRNFAWAAAGLLAVAGVVGMPAFLDAYSSESRPSPVFLFVLLDSILPPALLVATLFTVGPMAYHHELTALQAAGQSMGRIMRPLIVTAAVAAAYSVALKAAGMIGSGLVLTTAAAQTEFHARLAYPLSSLFAVLIGIVLASTPRRKTVYGGFIWALACLYGFHLLSSLAQAYGRNGLWPPIVAGWAGSVAATAAIAVMWWRMRR